MKRKMIKPLADLLCGMKSIACLRPELQCLVDEIELSKQRSQILIEQYLVSLAIRDTQHVRVAANILATSHGMQRFLSVCDTAVAVATFAAILDCEDDYVSVMQYLLDGCESLAYDAHGAYLADLLLFVMEEESSDAGNESAARDRIARIAAQIPARLPARTTLAPEHADARVLT